MHREWGVHQKQELEGTLGNTVSYTQNNCILKAILLSDCDLVSAFINDKQLLLISVRY